MKDTPPEVDVRYRAMLMQQSGAERFLMGCAMRETARTLVEASIRKQDPLATLEAIRKGLFSASTDTNSMPRAGRRFSLPLSLHRLAFKHRSVRNCVKVGVGR